MGSIYRQQEHGIRCYSDERVNVKCCCVLRLISLRCLIGWLCPTILFCSFLTTTYSRATREREREPTRGPKFTLRIYRNRIHSPVPATQRVTRAPHTGTLWGLEVGVGYLISGGWSVITTINQSVFHLCARATPRREWSRRMEKGRYVWKGEYELHRAGLNICNKRVRGEGSDDII